MANSISEKEFIAECRSWSPRGCVAMYEHFQGFTFPQHMYPTLLGLCDWRIQNLMVNCGPGAGKALHPDTKVLCEQGWRPIKDLKIGDKVRHPDGKNLSTIIATHYTAPEPLYRFRFADGRELLAHENHLWKVHHKKMNRARGHGNHGKGPDGIWRRGQQGERGEDGLLWDIVSTKDIKSRMESQNGLRWFVPLIASVDFPEADLPIPPYILGCILGDGHINPKAVTSVTCADEEIGSRISLEGARAGIGVRRNSYRERCPVWFFSGIRPLIRNLGLQGKRSWEKFIPEIYKYASYAQRLALLQGIMDTDGCATDKNSIHIGLSNEKLAKEVQELVWSLGGIAKITSRSTFFTYKEEKKQGRTCYSISIRYRNNKDLFSLNRKKDRVKTEGQYSKTLKLRILDIIKETTPEPSVCISVDNPDGLFIAENYIVTHNSVVTSQIFPTLVLGHNPEENIICISGAEDLATGFQSVVAAHISENPLFHKVFSSVKPDKQRGWSNTSGIFVTGHRAASPDASFWSAGIASKAITGKHGTLIICDDLHTEQNSTTEDQCQSVVRTFVTQILGRQDPRGARFIVTGRRWHESDLYGRLMKNGDFVTLTLPYERPNSKRLWYDIVIPDGLECVFTDGKCKPPNSDELLDVPDAIQTALLVNKKARLERLDNGVALRRIEWPYGIDKKGEGFFWPEMDAKRREYFSAKRLEPAATEAVYQCSPGARQGSVFLESDFARRYVPIQDQYLGVQNRFVAEMCQKGIVIQSWDTAFSASASSDYSVGITLLLVPCEHYHRDEDPERFGPCERHFDIYVMDVWRDKANFAGVERQMRELYHLWKPSLLVVEKRAYAVTAIENLQNAGIPIEPVDPSPLESKRARAVEGVFGGSVQGWCRSWRVVLPEEAEWLGDFLKEMKDFTGAKGGTDDQVDSLVHGIRWAISNGGGADLPVEWADPEKIDVIMRMGDHMGRGISSGMMSNFAAGFNMEAFDPFGDCCGHCRHFAKVVKDRNIPTNRDMTKTPNEWCLLHNRVTQAIGSCEDHIEVDDFVSHPFFGQQ